MKKVRSKKTTADKKMSSRKRKKLPGYPLYPDSDDIYQKDKEEKNIDPEDITKRKTPIEKDKPGLRNERNSENDFSGNDLDIPGSELDDEQENIGSEDEENNSYSLGGDDHNDLEEN